MHDASVPRLVHDTDMNTPRTHIDGEPQSLQEPEFLPLLFTLTPAHPRETAVLQFVLIRRLFQEKF